MVGVFAQFRVNPAGLTAADGSRINGLRAGDGSLLWHQTLAVLAVICLTAALTCGLGIIIRATLGLRATSEQEDLGLGGMFQADGSAGHSDRAADQMLSLGGVGVTALADGTAVTGRASEMRLGF